MKAKTKNKVALICGISGQDGAYLSKLLLSKGYQVWGTSRDAQVNSFSGLKYLGIREQVRLCSMAINDFRSVLQVISQVKPDEIYNLAGQTSVGLSFEQPMETLESIAMGTINLLECMRFLNMPIKLYNACSSECFGDTKGKAAKEETPFHPCSPYAMSKGAAYWGVANYRNAYGLFACSGILFNHESPLRPERFVTRKIVATACRIAAGSREKLRLGNWHVSRDWGYAVEYVEPMWKMLQQKQAEDFVIATGESHTLKQFADEVFFQLGLKFKKYVEQESSLYRPLDIPFSLGCPTKAFKKLGWKAKTGMKELIKLLIEAEQCGSFRH